MKFYQGMVPHNKGVQMKHVIHRYKAVLNKEPIQCNIHGLHSNWRIHSNNNVQCKLCCKESAYQRRIDKPITYLLIDAKRHAKERGIVFSLTESDILEVMKKQENRCILSGIEFNSEIGSLGRFSLDRINPNDGYIKDNIQLVSVMVNRMKSNFSQEEFIKMCGYIYSKAGKSRR